MSSQGPNSGSTFENDATVGMLDWTSPGNAVASDDVYASVALTTTNYQSHYLKATGFEFTIPTGATINGIKVESEVHGNGNFILYYQATLVKGGTIQGTVIYKNSQNDSDVYVDYGGSTELWDLSWTAGDINASNFGCAISSNTDGEVNLTSYLDHIRITVYYTPGAVDVTVAVGLQSGSKSLFSVSEKTDQVLSQGLIAKAGSLFAPSENTDQILGQDLPLALGGVLASSQNTDQVLDQILQTGSKTIFSVSNVTDQVLSQNLLGSIASILSALISIDVEIDTGLQSGAKTLFSVSNVTDQVLSQGLLSAICSILESLQNTDQMLDQNLISKGATLFPPSFVLDHILIQNLQTGTQTILHPSNITDQVLGQNILSVLSAVLASSQNTDQILSVNLVQKFGSLYEVTVEIVTGETVVSLSLLITTGSVLGLSLQTDQILHQNALSALAALYQILVQIKAKPENFGYLKLKLEAPEVLPEGDFAYEHSSLKMPD